MDPEKFIKEVDARTAEWWKEMTRELKESPPLGDHDEDDRAFYIGHKEKAEWWAAQGDGNYMAALAIVAPDEAERFVRVAKIVAAEEALKRYA